MVVTRTMHYPHPAQSYAKGKCNGAVEESGAEVYLSHI